MTDLDCPFDPALKGHGQDFSMPDLARWLPQALAWRWPRWEATYGTMESDWAGGVRTPGRRIGLLVGNILDSVVQWLDPHWRADLDDHHEPSTLMLMDATRVRYIPISVGGTGRLRIAEFDGQAYQLRYGGDALVKAIAAHAARFFRGPVEMIESDPLDPDLTSVPSRRRGARPLGYVGAAARV